MAQWSRQYSGNTHGSRVQDYEQSLAHAINVYRDSECADNRAKQRKTVFRMADRLLAARMRMRKANKPRKPGVVDRKLQRIIDGGVDAILQEFGIADELFPSDDDADDTTSNGGGS